MSDLVQLTYKRVSETTCALEFLQAHPDTISWLYWSAGGGHIVDNNRGAAGAMAMIWLYELVLHGSSTELAPHPFGELIRRGSSIRGSALPRFEQVPGERYPYPSAIVAQLIDAANELIVSCDVEEIAGGDYDGGQRLTFEFACASTLDAVGELGVYGSTIDAKFLDWANCSFAPHGAAFDPEELARGVNFHDAQVELRPFEGSMEGGTPDDCILFTPDGELLILVSQAAELAAYDTTNFEERWRTSLPDLSPEVSFDSALGMLRARVYGRLEVHLIDPKTGEITETRPTAQTWTHHSVGGKWAFDMEDYEPLKIGSRVNALIRENQDAVESDVFSVDGRYCALVRADRVEVWDMPASELVASIPTDNAVLASFSHTNDRVAILEASTLRVCSLPGGELLSGAHVSDPEISAFGYCGHDEYLLVVHGASFDEPSSVRLYSSDGGAFDFDSPTRRAEIDIDVKVVVGSRDGEHALLAGWDESVLVVLETLEIVWRSVTDVWGDAIVLSADGENALLLSSDEVPTVIDLATGEEVDPSNAINLQRYPRLGRDWVDDIIEYDVSVVEQPGNIEILATSTDDRYALIGGMYRSVALWDFERRQVIRTYDVSRDRVCSLRFSPDGRYFSVGYSRMIEIRRVACGAVVNAFTSHHYLDAPVWSPDASQLVLTHVTGYNGFGGHYSVHDTFGRSRER